MFRASSCPSSGVTNCSNSLWFTYYHKRYCFVKTYKTVSLMTIGKPEAVTAVVAPDGGHEDARNMLSCI